MIKVADMTRGIAIIAALGGLALLAAAQLPSALAMTSPGDCGR